MRLAYASRSCAAPATLSVVISTSVAHLRILSSAIRPQARAIRQTRCSQRSGGDGLGRGHSPCRALLRVPMRAGPAARIRTRDRPNRRSRDGAFPSFPTPFVNLVPTDRLNGFLSRSRGEGIQEERGRRRKKQRTEGGRSALRRGCGRQDGGDIWDGDANLCEGVAYFP